MGNLIIKLAKYQINFDILPTYPEKFIVIKRVWPQIQPQRQTEVKIKIYTTIDYEFMLFDCSGFGI